MRTTLSIEPAVAEHIRKRMEAKEQTLKSVINEALRVGLRTLEQSESGVRNKLPRFVVRPHRLELRPGIDPDRLGRFAEEVEEEDMVARLHAK